MKKKTKKSMLQTASTETRARLAEKKLKILVEALHGIACWDSGPVVTGVFDDPGTAQAARDALAKAGIRPPKHVECKKST